jgi:hypothetical protein
MLYLWAGATHLPDRKRSFVGYCAPHLPDGKRSIVGFRRPIRPMWALATTTGLRYKIHNKKASTKVHEIEKEKDLKRITKRSEVFLFLLFCTLDLR